MRHHILCPEVMNPFVRAMILSLRCGQLPLSTADQWHEVYGFALALLAFGIVFGAFAGNVLAGAMAAVPKAQLETGESFGANQRQIFRRILLPQMWIYALPGLSNLWMILIKATPLFLLGIEDIVYWARELGAQDRCIHLSAS